LKKLLIGLIRFYQKVPGRFHNNCIYVPTCSNYALEAINTYGVFKGSFLSIKRLLRCNPFHKGGYDPVPMKEKK